MQDAKDQARIDRFRHVAFWEGVSYVALVAIAMPIKYLAGEPAPVKYVGWAHGVLFILYAVLLLDAAVRLRWSVKRVALYFLASLLPVAPFFVERALRREQKG